jgi:serine phosphatase RsbU (regulator of sigma subunit)/CHASE3 domain sensor protein
MTLRLRVICGVVVALAGGALAFIQIFIGMHQTHAADRAVSSQWAPAAAASDQLLAHLVDQETGERGYVITGDAAFLQPYDQGRAKTAQDLTQIRSLVGEIPAVGSALAAVEADWKGWLSQIAVPEIQARNAGQIEQSQLLVDRAQGRTVFDALRAKVASLQQDIDAREAAQRQQETAAIARLERTLIATAVGVVVFTVLWLGLLSAWVLRPLMALQHRLGRATAGAFREVIPEVGPPELRNVAKDAELMRVRLLRELELSENARQALEQRGPVVLGLSERLRLSEVTPLPGLQIASALHAAVGVVAGDLLDVVQIDERRVGVVIADVSGHGAIAGLEAITLKDVIGTALRLGRSPAQALDVAADQARADERFATCAIVVIDVVTGELAYANAGHLPPLIIPAGEAALSPDDLRTLEPTGPLLSVLARGWDVGTGQLRPGEVLLLVTDGLLEARTVSGDEFGIAGLCEALNVTAARDVHATVAAITAAARAYAEDYRRDDVTVLAVMRDLETAPSIEVSKAIPCPVSTNARADVPAQINLDDLVSRLRRP